MHETNRDGGAEALIERLGVYPTGASRPKLDALTNTQVQAYGIGHFLNDTVAGLFGNYFLFYLINKQPIDPDPATAASLVGLVLLCGQVADGIATPIIGVLSDKTNTKLGKRMPWYYVGVILVSVPTIFAFQPCIFCRLFGKTSYWAFLNYTFMCVVLNIGWAMCQVSHMSLVPSLSLSRERRDHLNNLRGTNTFIANLMVLIFAAVSFAVIDDERLKYELLCQVSVGCGVLASLFFIYHIQEKALTRACRRLAKEFKRSLAANPTTVSSSNVGSRETFHLVGLKDSPEPKQKINSEVQVAPLDEDPPVHIATQNQMNDMTQNYVEAIERRHSYTLSSVEDFNFHWYQWFYSAQFWLYGLVYMSARIYNNFPICLLLFYLNYGLNFAEDQDSKTTKTPFQYALIPMVLFISSSIMATQLTRVFKKVGRKYTYIAAASVGFLVGFVLYALPAELKYAIYGVVIFLGVIQSTVLNTSIAYISEVVGIHGAHGAFVYGFYSLFEKIANGVLLWIVLNYQNVDSPDSEEYLRFSISVVPCSALLLGLVCVALGKAKDYRASSGEEHSDVVF